MTYTYAVLEISRAAYAEIRAKLAAVDYAHTFHRDGARDVIDMHGIALAVAPPQCATCQDEGRHVDAGGCPDCGRVWPGAV